MAIDKQHKILNAPTLRFPEFDGKWHNHMLSDYLVFKNGLNPDAKRFGKGMKFISVMDILNNLYITYDVVRSSVEAREKDLEDFSVNYGDILFQRSSETLEDVGRSNVYLDERPCLFGGFVIRGKKKGDYNPVFFKYLLDSPYARKKIIVKGAGAQHFNIGQEGLSKVCLNFPEKAEQDKIAKVLSVVDERISTQIRIIEDLKQLKNGIAERLYCNTPNYRIGDVITQLSRRNRSLVGCPVLSVSNRYGFIEQSEQFEDRIVASEDTSNYKVVEFDDFAYNPARINVGSIARLMNYERGIVSPMYICFHTKDSVRPSYLEYFFTTRYFFNEIEKRLEGSVRLCLSYEGLCNIPIYIPIIEEQERISRRMSALCQKINFEENYLRSLRKQKQYLLSQMFI